MSITLRTSLLLGSLLLTACAARPPAPATEPVAAADRLAFSGVLHCPDCAGLRVHLLLDRDTYRYRTREERLGDTSAAPRINTGLWQLVHGTEDNPDAVVYQLDYDRPASTRNFLRLDDEHIKLLDENGREFWSPYNLILERTRS